MIETMAGMLTAAAAAFALLALALLGLTVVLRVADVRDRAKAWRRIGVARRSVGERERAVAEMSLELEIRAEVVERRLRHLDIREQLFDQEVLLSGVESDPVVTGVRVVDDG